MYNEQQEIIDGAYENYANKCNEDKWMKEIILDLPFPNKSYGLYSQEEFINKIKTDDEFAKKWGELGPIYGKQWRSWTYLTREQKEDIDGIDEGICGVDMFDSYRYYRTIDQIANSINLLKTDPDSRRNRVNAWNVGELDQMTLPPCHTDFQFYTRELSEEERLQVWDSKFGFANDEQKNQFNPDVHLDTHGIPKRAISLMWNQRSVDTFLGLPFNIASYGLLLEIIAKEVNMVPDELIGNLGDTHLYLNHIEQAKEQIGIDLTDEERYHIWFGNNYETGMERFFDPNNLPNFDDVYYEPTPNRTREPYALPQLSFLDEYHYMSDTELVGSIEFSEKINKFRPDFFKIENYQSHPSIKAPLSN
jgi:thymidylate synthase